MIDKKTLKTKTFWLGLVSVGWGITEIVQGNVEQGIVEIKLGLLAIFARDAYSKGK